MSQDASQTVRAFLAVELPPSVKAALAALTEELGRTAVRGLRLARTEGVHLTLKFLGDIPQDQVVPIVAAASSAVQEHDGFTLELGSVGVFPSRASPRVLWVGIEGEVERLLALHRRIDDALAALGFARESRAFTPHLTVARMRVGAPASDRRIAAEALFSAGVESGLSLDVDSVSLMRSLLLPSGAVYEPLAKIPLRSGFRNEGGE